MSCRFFRTNKEYIGAGRIALLSISGRLGLSIFCRKIERTQLMKKEMDRKVFISR